MPRVWPAVPKRARATNQRMKTAPPLQGHAGAQGAAHHAPRGDDEARPPGQLTLPQEDGEGPQGVEQDQAHLEGGAAHQIDAQEVHRHQHQGDAHPRLEQAAVEAHAEEGELARETRAAGDRIGGQLGGEPAGARDHGHGQGKKHDAKQALEGQGWQHRGQQGTRHRAQHAGGKSTLPTSRQGRNPLL
jgi:hypothetical protein